MRSCPYMEGCRFLSEMLDGLPESFGNELRGQYCEAAFDECARYIVLMELGKERVPQGLWPHQLNEAEEILRKART